MKNNLFKNESKNDARDRDSFRNRKQDESRSENAFGLKKKEEKEKDLKLDMENFPELTVKADNQTNQTNQTNQDFISALNKTSQQVNTAEKVQPGWVKIKLDPYKGCIYEYGKPTYNQMDNSLNDEVNSSIEMMKKRWNQYKDDYMELCGEDEYDRYYPPYISIDYEIDVGDENLGY
jgi:hypothetical protein